MVKLALFALFSEEKWLIGFWSQKDPGEGSLKYAMGSTIVLQISCDPIVHKIPYIFGPHFWISYVFVEFTSIILKRSPVPNNARMKMSRKSEYFLLFRKCPSWHVIIPGESWEGLFWQWQHFENDPEPHELFAKSNMCVIPHTLESRRAAHVALPILSKTRRCKILPWIRFFLANDVVFEAMNVRFTLSFSMKSD